MLGIVGAAAVLTPTVLSDRSLPGSEAGSAAVEESDCNLDVVSAPDIASALEGLAPDFQAEDQCAVTVEAAPPASVAGALAEGWDEAQVGPLPDVWIPDSSAWVRYVESSEDGGALLPEDRPSVARSPLIAGMPRPMAEQLGWPEKHPGWIDLLGLLQQQRNIWIESGHPEWGPFRLGLTDPTRSTTGLHALLSFGAAQSSAWNDVLETEGLSHPDVRTVLLTLERGNARLDESVDDQLRLLREADSQGEALTFLSAMPLSERDVWRYNRGLIDGAAEQGPPNVPLAGLYPDEGAVDLDYPYLVLQHEQDSRQERLEAAARFRDFLLSESTQSQLQADGFRNHENVFGPPLEELAELQPDQAEEGLPAPGGGGIVTALDGWGRIAQVGTTLAVIDVSGSMGVRIPGTDTTLLDLTVASAVRGVELFSSESRLGLWEFSTDLPGGEQDGDYRELVAIGPADEDLGNGVTRRQKVATALQGLELANDTALYDTILAAYREVQDKHDGGPLNTVALFTDGHSDGDDLALDALLAELEDVMDPEQPVHIAAIAWGPEADVESLQAVVEVTGGEVFTPGSPEDIAEVFLKVLTGV